MSNRPTKTERKWSRKQNYFKEEIQGLSTNVFMSKLENCDEYFYMAYTNAGKKRAIRKDIILHCLKAGEWSDSYMSYKKISKEEWEWYQIN